jgi:hypothetical protein
MGQTVKLRRSAISGKIPINSQLLLGELSMNTTDGKIFLSKSGSNGPSVEEVIITNTQNFGNIDLVGDLTATNISSSFIGDGGGLYNIPASGVTGLSLDRIASSTSTASIDADGLHINTDTTVTGSLTATEFTGSGLGLTDVPIKISGSDAGSTSIDSTFTRIKFDDSTGIKISGTTGGDAVVFLSGVASESDGGEGKTAKLEVTSATSTWTLNHNLNEKHPSIEVFDSNDEVIIPQKIEATSVNQVVVSFASPQTGTVTATVGGGLPSIDSGYENRVLSVDNNGIATWKTGILSGSIDFSTLVDTGSFNTYTSSNDNTNSNQNGRLDSLEEFTSSIDDTYATDNDVTTLRTDLNTYTSSTDGRLDSLETTSGSSNLRLDYIESVTSSHHGRLNSLETISGSHDGRLDSIESKTGSFLVSNDLSTIEGKIGSLETTSGSHEGKLSSLETTSGSHDGRLDSLETTSGSHDGRLTDLETFETKVDTGLEFTGSNVTIKGNLLVKGTETRVDSTTVDIDDNILSLNGSGAANAGIEVRDTESPGVLSGSLIYDTGENTWKAGTKGSEERLLINSDLTTLDGRLDSLESTSGSHEDRIDRIEISTSSLNSFTSSINTTIKGKLNNDGVISGSIQIDHDATTNYVGNEHIDHSSITIGSGKGLTGGGTIDTNRSLTLDTGSVHFLSGVKSKLNTETVVSGSAQIDITGTTNYNLVDGRLDSIESFTSSIDLTYATDDDVTDLRNDLNTYTSSNDDTNSTQNGRLDSIESSTGSYLTSYNDEYTTGATFSTSNGVVTFTRNDGDQYTVDLDGRYLTSFTETDPIFTAHAVYDITSTQIGNWDTAYGWGDHSQEGYLTTYNNEYTTGATFNGSNGIITFTRNDGDTYTLNISSTLTDINVTGGTYNDSTQTLRLNKSNGTSIDVTGFAVDTVLHTTGATFNSSNGVVTFTKNGGDTYTVDLDGRYLTSFTETDPIFTAHAVYDITSTQISNWDTAYGWGNHASAGYLTSYTDTNEFVTGATFNDGNGIVTFTRNNGGDTFTVDLDGRYLEFETNGNTSDVNNVTRTIFSANNTNGSTSNRPVNWSTVYTLGGGYNALQLGTNEDYSESGLWVRQYNGNSASPQGSGWQNWTEVWTTNHFSANDRNNWNTAYGWGDHGTAGYLTSFTETDPVFTSHAAYDITSTQISNWDTAYGWGDHGSAGYLTSYNDEYTTGATFNGGNGIITFTRNDGDTYTVDISSTLTDINVTGGTYNDANQTLTLNKSNGSSVDVTGFAVDTVLHTTGATFNSSNGVITFTKNGGDTYTVDIDGRFLTSYTETQTLNDVTTLGATTSNDLQVGGLTISDTFPYLDFVDTNSFTDTADRFRVRAGGNNGMIQWSDSSAGTVTTLMTFLPDGKITMGNGIQFTATGGVDMGTNTITDGKVAQWNTAYGWGDHSQAGYLTTYNNEYTTGATFNTSNGVITFTRNDGDQFTVDIDGRYLTSFTETDTLSSVTSRGNSTNNSISVGDFLASHQSAQNATTKAEMLSMGVAKFRPHSTNSGTLAIAQVDAGNSVGLQFTNGAGTADWDMSLQPFGGNVGINKVNPSGALHVYSGTSERFLVSGDVHVQGSTDLNINGASRRLSFTSGTGTIRTTTANELYLQTNSTTAITIDANQNVEISGTLSASGYNKTNWDTAYGWGDHSQAGYVTSSGNTIIGTDSDINTSGSYVVDQLTMTDGVITSHSTRQLSELRIPDTRAAEKTPNEYTDQHLSLDFTDEYGSLGSWYSGITLKGWTGTYAAWQLISEADSGIGDTNLYFRQGNGTTWQSMRTVWTSANFANNSSNWNTAYGWGDHSQAGYLTSSSTQSKYLRSDTDDTTTGALTIGEGTNQARLIIKKADNDVSDHIVFYNGTTRIGEIGAQDDTWLRINQNTSKNIYTPRYIRADAGFFVDGTSKGINGSGNFIGGTIAGASDANVTNWDTAYEWGDHSQEGYLTSYNDEYTTGATFNGGNGIITFTRNDGDQYTVDISSTLTDINVTGGTYNDANQTLTLNKSNGSSVDVTGFAVDTVLHTTGATFNSGNGVVTFTKNGGDTYTVDLDGRYLTSESNSFLGDGGSANTHPGTNKVIFTGQVSAGSGALGMPTVDNSNAFLNINRHSGEYNSQLGFSSNGNIYYRKFSAAAINSTQAWLQVYHSGNFTNNSSNWNTAYGWGDHSTAGYITSQATDFVSKSSGGQFDGLITIKEDTNTSTTAGKSLLTLHNENSDISQQQSFIDFKFTDTNANYTPQVRIGAQVGPDADANAMSKEGAGSFVVYTAPVGSDELGNSSGLAEQFRVSYNGTVTAQGQIVATGGNSGNWNTAYGWGDHSQVGYLTSSSTQSKYLRTDVDDTIESGSIISFKTAAGTTRGFLQSTDTNDEHFIIATSGGEDIAFKDGGVAGTTNMVIRGDGNVVVTGSVTASGGNSGNWNTAYGWGDHSQEGYIKSFDNDIDYINSASFDTGTGVITGTGVGNAGFTVDIDGRYLKISDKAADSDKLDGIDSSEFLRSNTADTFTGTITMGTQKALVANNYGRGVYGIYSSTRYQHVWSMGTSYNLSDDGTSAGNLYGLAFTHTNVGGESKSGLDHQMLIMRNGTTVSAIGAGIWTDGTITTTSHGNSSQWNTAYGWGNHASAGYASSSHTHSTSDITSGTFVAARFSQSTRYNIGLILGYSSQTRDKIRVWDSSEYSIGMKNGYDYGHIGSGEYAMSFQMSNTAGRGWWWGDTSHTDDQGAASITTEGKMVIAKSLSVGQGETITNPSDTPLYVEGTTAGETVFEVQGTSGQLFSITDSLIGDIFEVSDISGIPILTVNSSGVVTVDDTLHVTGDVIAYYASDKRLKDNIKPIENAIDKIKMIGGYEFDWNSNSKNNNGHDVGVIAQEIEEVLPELVGTRSDGYKGVKYEKLTALLIQSNKELIERVEELESKLKK